MITITFIISATVVLSYMLTFPKTKGILRPVKVPVKREY